MTIETRVLKREEMTEKQKEMVDVVDRLYKEGTIDLMQGYEIYKAAGVIIIAE